MNIVHVNIKVIIVILLFIKFCLKVCCAPSLGAATIVSPCHTHTQARHATPHDRLEALEGQRLKGGFVLGCRLRDIGWKPPNIDPAVYIARH